MKKLKFDLEQLQGVELLSAEQLKRVVGGYAGSGDVCPEGEFPCYCSKHNPPEHEFLGCFSSPTACINAC